MKLFRIIMALCVLVSAQNNLFGLPPRRGAQPAAPTQTGPKKGAPQKPGNTLADLVDRALAGNKSAKNLSPTQLTQLRNAFKGQIAQSEVGYELNETPLQTLDRQVKNWFSGDLSQYVDNQGKLTGYLRMAFNDIKSAQQNTDLNNSQVDQLIARQMLEGS